MQRRQRRLVARIVFAADAHPGLFVLQFGLGIRQLGFNIFVAGMSGTGRTTIEPEKIGCPILCVGGADDRSYVPKAERLARVYGADWFEQPDAGHDMMLEAAAMDAAQRVNHWLIGRLGLGRTPCVRTAARD